MEKKIDEEKPKKEEEIKQEDPDWIDPNDPEALEFFNKMGKLKEMGVNLNDFSSLDNFENLPEDI